MKLDLDELVNKIKYYKLEDLTSKAKDFYIDLPLRHPAIAWLKAVERFLNEQGYEIVKKTSEPIKGDKQPTGKTNYNKSMSNK